MTAGISSAPVPLQAAVPEADREARFSRWAGWTALAGTLAFVVTIVMTSFGPPSPDGPGDVLAFLDDVAAGGASAYVYGVAGIALCILYIPMAVAVHRILGKTTMAWHGSAAMVVGLTLLIPAYLVNVLPPFVFVSLAEAGVGADALYAAYALARAIAELFFTVGSVLTLGLGPLMWGFEWLRTPDLGRRLGWVAVVAGVSGMVWFVWLVPNGVFGIALLVNVLVSLVLFTGIASVLVARGRAGA